MKDVSARTRTASLLKLHNSSLIRSQDKAKTVAETAIFIRLANGRGGPCDLLGPLVREMKTQYARCGGGPLHCGISTRLVTAMGPKSVIGQKRTRLGVRAG
jgi:hypothetical protein